MPYRTLAALPASASHTSDLICLSHLRWNFVYQRPQHLMSRYALTRRVYFLEEPIVDDDLDEPEVSIAVHDRVFVVVPRLPRHYDASAGIAAQRAILDHLILSQGLAQYVLWYYTPLALRFSSHLAPAAVVYDCMDELSAFKGASSDLPSYERALLSRADVVFTGGQSLYEAKRHLHRNIHPIPSSVDVAHFASARTMTDRPDDQRAIPGPRLGFFGVIDERFDVPLLDAIATARPEWQFVIVGPVVKIDPVALPRRPNIHYLGAKTYDALPRYLAGWDVALLLFARNDATRFISPTKTPEYLAAGAPVVSTSIQDVVRPYGEQGFVRIADTPSDFIRACEQAMAEPAEPRRARTDALLRTMSWERTWSRTATLLQDVLDRRMRQQPLAAHSTEPALGL